MTEEQKELLIAKMLDTPSSLSEEDLELILHDEELHGIYEVSAALSGACIRQPELDMRAEWNSFRPRIKRKPTMMCWSMRVAAIFIGVILVSGIAIRIIDNVSTRNQTYVIAKVEQSEEAHDYPVVLQNYQATEVKEETKQEPATVRRPYAVTDRHLAKAEIDQSKTTVGQVETDVDEYLRIQQARIDNDLAMQVAESYTEEYDDLVAILDAAGAYNPELDNVIRKVTME